MEPKKMLVIVGLVLLVTLTACAGRKGETSQFETPKPNPNRDAVTENIHRKLETLDAKGLLAVSRFIDSIWESKVKDKEILVLTVGKNEFPPILEEVFTKHERLNTLPRRVDTLVVLASKKNPAVRNVYVEIPATAMKDKDTVFMWMPNPSEWSKFVDLPANRLEGLRAEESFLTLFAMGCAEWNPELMRSVEKSKWDWNKMIHPKNTKPKKMYVPIATLTPAIKEFLK